MAQHATGLWGSLEEHSALLENWLQSPAEGRHTGQASGMAGLPDQRERAARLPKVFWHRTTGRGGGRPTDRQAHPAIGAEQGGGRELGRADGSSLCRPLNFAVNLKLL